MAAVAPSAFSLMGGHVGYIWNCPAVRPDINNFRLVGIVSSSVAQSANRLCELRTASGSVYVDINDTTNAARKSPLCYSEIRAALSRFGRKRVLKSWLYPLSLSDAISSTTVFQTPHISSLPMTIGRASLAM